MMVEGSGEGLGQAWGSSVNFGSGLPGVEPQYFSHG